MKIKIIDLGEHVDGEQNIKSVIVQGDKIITEESWTGLLGDAIFTYLKDLGITNNWKVLSVNAEEVEIKLESA
jgi:hypothetical protein